MFNWVAKGEKWIGRTKSGAYISRAVIDESLKIIEWSFLRFQSDMMNDLLIQLLIYHCFINLEHTVVKVKM